MENNDNNTREEEKDIKETNGKSDLPWYEKMREDEEERKENGQSPSSVSPLPMSLHSLLDTKTRSLKVVMTNIFSAVYPRCEGFRIKTRVNNRFCKNDRGWSVYSEKMGRYISYNAILTCRVFIFHRTGRSSMEIDFEYNLNDSEKVGKTYDDKFVERVTKTALDRKSWIIKNLHIK